VGALEAVAGHRLFDRLIRGRAWIGIVAFALIGIVTLQLGLLKLNGGIGRALEHEAMLQRTNTALSIENSELAAGTRIEAQARRLGMAFAPSGSLHFLSANAHADIAKATAALSSAARAVAQSHEASVAAAAGESQASESSTTSESEASQSSSASTSGESSGESSSEPSGEAEASPSASSEETSSSEASSAAPAGEAESSSAASSEAEPSGGISASAGGG
jgi:cell division protein FtsL